MLLYLHKIKLSAAWDESADSCLVSHVCERNCQKRKQMFQKTGIIPHCNLLGSARTLSIISAEIKRTRQMIYTSRRTTVFRSVTRSALMWATEAQLSL